MAATLPNQEVIPEGTTPDTTITICVNCGNYTRYDKDGEKYGCSVGKIDFVTGVKSPADCHTKNSDGHCGDYQPKL